MSLGTNIAHYRKKKNLTQAELGELVGVSNQAVSKWEAELTMPDVMLLPQIAQALSIKLEDLYRDSPAQAEATPVPNGKILHIFYQEGENKTELRLPVQAMRPAIEDVLGEDEKVYAAAFLDILDGPTGTIVDATGKKGRTTIILEEHEN